jgi:uncharacterized protein
VTLELVEPDSSRPPARRLAPRAPWAWRIGQAGVWAGVWLVVAVIGMIAGAPWWVFAVPGVVLVAAVSVIPPLRWSRWRWDVRTDGIDIRHGTFTIKRTLVPWVRVQHVDTRQGVLEQRLKLVSVVVYTAAGGFVIPLLDEPHAAELRDRVAELARG